MTINDKPFIQYVGLLEESHKRGIQSLEVDIVQFPKAYNDFTCICKATLESNNSEIFTDYDDASHKSISNKILPHLIRMASTRSKARVMRVIAIYVSAVLKNLILIKWKIQLHCPKFL